MHHSKWLNILIVTIFTAITQIANATDATSPIGYWKTIDKVTGKPQSIVQIYRAQDQILMGKVIKVFPSSVDNTICTACKGNYHNQPLVGMVIISGLQPAETQWNKGQLLDPSNGKTYSCSLRVADKGKKLNVDGYFGIPLFGHTQIWERVDLMAG